MIKMYDSPRKVKLSELFPQPNEKYYIQTFEYGDFDNWVTALIYKTNLVIDDYSLNSRLVKDGEYRACLATTFIPIDEAEKMGGDFIDSNRKFVGYGDNMKISKLEDITEAEITVNGEWTRG